MAQPSSDPARPDELVNAMPPLKKILKIDIAISHRQCLPRSLASGKNTTKEEEVAGEGGFATTWKSGVLSSRDVKHKK